jgi:hypothetical protein
VFISAGADVSTAQYIQLVHEVGPLITGLWLFPGIIGLILGSMLAPSRHERDGATPGGGCESFA